LLPVFCQRITMAEELATERDLPFVERPLQPSMIFRADDLAAWHDVAIGVDHRRLPWHRIRLLFSARACVPTLRVKAGMSPAPHEQRYRRNVRSKAR
jgi:hypothetical protein